MTVTRRGQQHMETDFQAITNRQNRMSKARVQHESKHYADQCQRAPRAIGAARHRIGKPMNSSKKTKPTWIRS